MLELKVTHDDKMGHWQNKQKNLASLTLWTPFQYKKTIFQV